MNEAHAATSHPLNQDNSTVMPAKERAHAIRRARRALKALADHPGASRKQLGKARERLNDCYRLSDPGGGAPVGLATRPSAAGEAAATPESAREVSGKVLRESLRERGSPCTAAFTDVVVSAAF